MAHRLKRDSASLNRAREILSNEYLLGKEAITAPDERIAKVSELYMNSVQGVCAALAVDARPIAAALRRRVPSALHSVFSIEERKPSEFELLAELRA